MLRDRPAAQLEQFTADPTHLRQFIEHWSHAGTANKLLRKVPGWSHTVLMQVPPESTNPAAALQEVQEVADWVHVAHVVVSQSMQVTLPALSRDENFPSGQVIHFWISDVVDSTESCPPEAHVRQLVAAPLQVKHVGSHMAHAGNRYWVAVLLWRMLPSVAKYPVLGHLSTHVPSSCFRRYPVWQRAHFVFVVSPTAQNGAAIGVALQPALINILSVESAQTVQFLV